MTTDSRERLILAADVGGTNLSLALMARRGSRIQVVRKASFRTALEPSLLAPVQRFLAEGGQERPDAVCVSGAGPVLARMIPLTNAPWDIDGEALERSLGIPVHLVNDFTAVARGVLLLDPQDDKELCPLPHLDGSLPLPAPRGTALVVGAGTGLGVAFITRDGDEPRVHPSEGGHLGLPITGEATWRLWQHLRPRFPGPPGAEAAVSGPGLAAIFGFLAASGPGPASPTVAAILALPEDDRPQAIARSTSDPLCLRTMELFVELYARVCAELCAVFLPTGGLYLAGGIAAKNERHFLDGSRFMASFERNYRPHLDAIARATPVYIVKDYAVSLYGAADTALHLLPRQSR
jgi:glucokinase